jgi:bifunctional DNA-binding transcriptional regulator/antitoxin component of YhaV-PrlF toxin-antitoxin module
LDREGEGDVEKQKLMVLRKLQKIHNSYYITLPKELLRALALRRGDYACVSTDEDKIIIRKLKVKNTDMLPKGMSAG